MDEYDMTRSKLGTFFAENFSGTSHMKIIEDRTTGTPQQTVWEMLIEIESMIDEPKLGLKKGVKMMIRGAVVQTWQWEGEGKEWDGSVSADVIEDWKIVQEHDYMCLLPEDGQGSKIKILNTSTSK